MPERCAAIGCVSQSEAVERENHGTTFHRFPRKRPEVLEKWLQNLGRGHHWTPTARSKLCSRHFSSDCSIRMGHRIYLKRDAVPTIFEDHRFGSHAAKNPREPLREVDENTYLHVLQQLGKSKSSTGQSLKPHSSDQVALLQGEVNVQIIQREEEPGSSKSHCVEPHSLEQVSLLQREVNGVQITTALMDHTYGETSSPLTLKRKLQGKQDAKSKKLKTCQQKCRRLKQRIHTLSGMLSALQKKQLISSNCAEILESNFSGVAKDLMSRLLDNKAKVYSEDIKSFELTLHFYSAKAYDYVRSTFGLALPHPRHIRTWYSKVEGEPGFTKSAFSTLKQKAESDAKHNKITVCSLMFDEIAIRKHVEFSSGEFHGYVDIGQNELDDTSPVAKDALVIMAVSLNDSWKMPLGYFLVVGLSGDEKANLMKECIHRLHDCGVSVASITCDGPSCNFKMMRTLGADLEIGSLKPSFSHPCDPSRNIHLLFDACHMLKLVRNTLGEIGLVKDQDGHYIRWSYITELNKLQEAEGLRLGNKLKNAHVEWKKQNMKVKLATQVFSSSVADALQYCNDELALPQFKGCEATVKFLRMFDALFDILNSRNPVAKGYKAPMRTTNRGRWATILDDAEKYILGLHDTFGTPTYRSKRRTGFLGFLMCIKSTQSIFQDYVVGDNSPLKYLLTYKLSQDHLELFFAAIRARGGCNNNPTALQFKGAYKRLLVKHNIKSTSGNCLPMDDTTILEVSADASVVVPDGQESIERHIYLASKYNVLYHDPMQSDHDYSDVPNVVQLSQYKESAIAYIAGYVVRMVKKRCRCSVCTSSLTEKDVSNIHSFLQLKDRGGLQKPSSSVVRLCEETEKCVQLMLKTSQGNLPHGIKVSLMLSTAVLQNVSRKSVFQELESHMFDTAVEENHVYNLMKLVSQSYCKIRLHHLARRATEKNRGELVRKTLSKLILFKHQ